MKSRKSLDYYKKIEYPILIEPRDTEEGNEYICYSPVLGKLSCYGLGKNYTEAIKDFNNNKEDFIEMLFEEGLEIPLPTEYKESKSSGKFPLRTLPQLHDLLKRQAGESNMSLNSYCNYLLTRGSSYQEFFKDFEMMARKFEQKILQITNIRVLNIPQSSQNIDLHKLGIAEYLPDSVRTLPDENEEELQLESLAR